MTASPYLGRCKDCDYALFTAAEDVREADNAVAGGPAVNIGNGQVMGRCPSRHRWFSLKRIEGTFSEAHNCDSRCLEAKGWKCTCSCGGMNHGRGHAATIVAEAPSAAPKAERVDTLVQETHYVPVPPTGPQEVPTSTPVGRHLGEVGKHIVGDVEVIGRFMLKTDAVLYIFKTQTGDIIKWFCPDYADPGFTIGDTLKLRAKVKAHDAFNNVNQTIVTYAEKV